jgi:hypothetical protein
MSTVTGRKGDALRAGGQQGKGSFQKWGVRRKHEAEPMYVANSEPTIWQRGEGRAGVCERGLISGEPNRSEVGRDMGRECVLPRPTARRGSLPVLISIVVKDIIKPNRIGESKAGQDTEGGSLRRTQPSRFTDSTDNSGPMKPGNRVEDKTLTTGKTERRKNV